MSKAVRRPQAPKRRNPVKSHMDEIHFPKVHRDRKRDDRWEDSLEARLQDYLDDLDDEDDPDPSGVKKKQFLSQLSGEDTENRKAYEDWLAREKLMKDFVALKGPTKGSLYWSKRAGKMLIYDGEQFVDPENTEIRDIQPWVD